MIFARRTVLPLVLVLSLTALSVVAPVTAAVYVVDQANPDAADTGPGTAEAPFKTIQHAADAAKAGDTVCVMEGTYDERVTIKSSSAEGKPLVLRALPRRSVTTRGFDTGNASWLRIEGFRVTNADATLADPGIRIGKGGTNIEIVDNLVEGIYTGIGGAGKAVRVTYNSFYRTQFGMVLDGGSDGWVIESNNLERQFQHRSGDCDYSRFWGQNHVVRYNRYHGTKRAEVGQAHLDCVQSFNVKKDNPGTFLHHLTFEYNFCSAFSQAFMISTSTPGTHHDYLFRNNIFWSHDGTWDGGAWGLCLTGMPNMKAENNTFTNIIWFGFGNADGQNGAASNNIFSGIAIPYRKGPGFAGHRNLIHNFKEKPKDPGQDELFEGDPKFVDLLKGNLRLAKGSPAIGSDGQVAGALEYPYVYYVDPQHPGATDDFWGYAAVPFKTVAKALAVAEPGETIVLRGGIYRETIAPSKAGLSLRAMKGEKVVVSGADLIVGWKREAGAWTAPLATEPKTVLRDGQKWTDFTYDPSGKRIVVKSGGDPRLRVFETVVREHGLSLGRLKDLRIEGIDVVNTIGEPIAGKAADSK